jgi:hypothetical protein
MGKDLFDLAGQSAPIGDDRSGGVNLFAWAFRGPERARQFEGRGEKTVRWPAASEKGAVGTVNEEHSALSTRSRLQFDAPGVGLWGAGAERRAIGGEGTGRASGIARPAEGRADIHQRLREVASSAAWRERPRRGAKFASRARERLLQGEKPRQNAGDIAVDRRGLAAKRDRRDRGCGIGANARKRAQFGFLARKYPAPSSDFLGASMQISRARIIAETRECAHHGFDRGAGQVLDSRPFRNEGLIIGRRRPRRRLLQQHFGEPDPVGIGRFPRFGAPWECAAAAVPPRKRTGDNLLSLCLGHGRAYIGAHVIDLMPRIFTVHAEAMMKRGRGGAKPLAEFTPGLIAEALAARGLSETSLIADWPAIVGDALARHARPIELQWPPRAAKRNPDAPTVPATLVLRVEGAFALEAQHSASVIVARVNAHLGWRCIDKIAFRQGPLPPVKEKRRPAPVPTDAAEAAARAAASPIVDDELRDAVTRLGARAIDRSARLARAAGARPPKGS